MDRRSWLTGLLAAAGVCAGFGAAAEWVVEAPPTPAPVSALRQDGGEVYVNAGGWYRLRLCEDELVCREPAEPPAPDVEAAGIPDGTVAEADNDLGGVRRAWYIEPTDRYAHGALGDTIEAAALAVQDVNGRLTVVRVREGEVFEDIAPRIADFDDDGENDVLAIRSSVQAGAAIVVYRLAGGTLAEVAATQPIGRSNRWLNVAAIADLTGNRRLDIAIVKTPHTGGALEIVTLERSRLRPVDHMDGFSNHVFGSTELALSAVGDVNGDRIADLVLPSADRRALRLVSAARGKLREIAEVPLPGAVATAIGTLEQPDHPVFVVGLDDGRMVVVLFREEPAKR